MPPKDFEWKKQCQKILDAFCVDKNAQPFLEPVPWKAYGLYDYPQIVKHPMDFGTIQKKMNGKSIIIQTILRLICARYLPTACCITKRAVIIMLLLLNSLKSDF